MTITLPPDLAKIIGQTKEEPIRVKDPNNNQEFILVKAEVYDRIRHLLGQEEDGLTLPQVGFLIQEAMREDDQNDPLLESYQNYQRKK